MHSEILVSAIMPTRGRAGWAHDAVRMWRVQTHEWKELVIVDDRMDPSFVVPLNEDGISYFRADRVTIGEKRNLACARSTGDVIMHWDSDDKYSPDRVEHQLAILLSGDYELVGYNIMPFEKENGELVEHLAAPTNPIGVSFCYWRATWESRPFQSINVGEDNNFREGRRLLSVPSDGRIVARIHRGNTSPKNTAANPAQWREMATA